MIKKSKNGLNTLHLGNNNNRYEKVEGKTNKNKNI